MVVVVVPVVVDILVLKLLDLTHISHSWMIDFVEIGVVEALGVAAVMMVEIWKKTVKIKMLNWKMTMI